MRDEAGTNAGLIHFRMRQEVVAAALSTAVLRLVRSSKQHSPIAHVEVAKGHLLRIFMPNTLLPIVQPMDANNKTGNMTMKNNDDPRAAVPSVLAASMMLAGGSALFAQQAGAQVQSATAQNVSESSTVGDQELLEAVTVTASRVKEEPRSVSVVTGEELEKFQVNNFRDIANRIGNVRTSWNNPNTASIFIRGVGWAAGAGVLDPSVGVTVDGVSHGISSISALSNYLDVETVEVQRGPTGVDGGKSSNIGRVVINTRRPEFTSEARASVTFGELHSVIATAVIGGGIIDDTLAYRLTVNRETAEGPFANRNDTHYTWRNTDRTNVRAQFLYTPNERVEALFALDYTPTGREICENCFTFRLKTPAFYDWLQPNGQPAPVNYANDNFGKIQRRWFTQKKDYTVDDYYAQEINTLSEYPNTYATRGASANVKYEFGGGSEFRSVSAFREYSFSQGAGTHTQFEWLRAPRGTQTSFNQLTQEFSLKGPLAATLDYQTGVWLYRGRFPNYSQTERYGSDAGAWYATAAQYALLDPVNPALPNARDPAGQVLLLNSADALTTLRKENYHNDSAAFYANLSWKATSQLTVDGGVRLSRESRKSWAESGILSDGFADELNPAFVNNVVFNGFNSNAAGALVGTNSAAQLALADFVAQKYFGVATYGGLTAAQRAQVGAAKGIRAGLIGAAYLRTAADKFSGTLPTASLAASYKLTDDHTVFGSVRYGEKAGISQIVGATATGGKSVPADAEKTTAFELGLKSNVLDNTLSFSAVVFLQNIKDYIQPGFVFDEAQTALQNDGLNYYLSALGNVPKARTKGLELDVTYSGIPYTTIRFAGAYTDAEYVDFPRAAPPGELSGRPGRDPVTNESYAYVDASGKALPGAPKYSGNLFADYSYPLANGKVFRANINYNYVSGYYPDQTLSRYTYTNSFGVADALIGIAWNKRFDVSLVAKNVFNENTGLLTAWNAYKPGIPRWLGVTANASLY